MDNYIKSFSDSHKQELMSKIRLAQFNICSLRKLIKYHLNGKQLLEARVVMIPDTTPSSRGTYSFQFRWLISCLPVAPTEKRCLPHAKSGKVPQKWL